jgi:hypothetical protein
MPTSTWGPPTWVFLHTLVEKLKDETFQESKHIVFQFISRICKNLPCPTCSAHAMLLLKRVHFPNVKTKEDFKHVLFIMHNAVNRQKGKALFEYSNLKMYANKQLIPTYNAFISVFKTRGNMTLLPDSMQRQILISDLKQWIQKNLKYFNLK